MCFKSKTKIKTFLLFRNLYFEQKNYVFPCKKLSVFSNFSITSVSRSLDRSNFFFFLTTEIEVPVYIYIYEYTRHFFRTHICACVTSVTYNDLRFLYGLCAVLTIRRIRRAHPYNISIIIHVASKTCCFILRTPGPLPVTDIPRI